MIYQAIKGNTTMNDYQSKKQETALKQLRWAWHNMAELEVECYSMSKHPEEYTLEDLIDTMMNVGGYNYLVEALITRYTNCKNYIDEVTIRINK